MHNIMDAPDIIRIASACCHIQRQKTVLFSQVGKMERATSTTMGEIAFCGGTPERQWIVGQDATLALDTGKEVEVEERGKCMA